MLYWAVVVAAALWEKEPEPWEATGATEVPYTPEPGCAPWALVPTDPEQQWREPWRRNNELDNTVGNHTNIGVNIAKYLKGILLGFVCLSLGKEFPMS